MNFEIISEIENIEIIAVGSNIHDLARLRKMYGKGRWRKLKWTAQREAWRGMAFWRLAWWYWLLSGYGERITHATVWLLLILVLFAGL